MNKTKIFLTLSLFLLFCLHASAQANLVKELETTGKVFSTNHEKSCWLPDAATMFSDISLLDDSEVEYTHDFTLDSKMLTIDLASDLEEIYRINSIEAKSGNVFRDKGHQTVYHISACKLDKDGKEKRTCQILIVEVKKGNGYKYAIKILSGDSYGDIYHITTYYEK